MKLDQLILLLLLLSCQNAEAAPLFAPSNDVAPRDAYAPYVRASTSFDADGKYYVADFLAINDDAALRVRSPDGQTLEMHRINDTDETLRLLADQRLEKLWLAVTDWAGPTLELQRDRRVDAARRALNARPPLIPSNTSESNVRPHARAVLKYVDAMSSSGYVKGAESLLRDEIRKSEHRTEWGKTDWSAMSLRLASVLFDEGDDLSAIALTREVEKTLGSDPTALNAIINRGWFLAESGRYAEALATLENVEPLFTRIRVRTH